MFCSKCGQQLPDGSTHCTACGTSFLPPQPQMQYPQQPQTPQQPYYPQTMQAPPQYQPQPQYQPPYNNVQRGPEPESGNMNALSIVAFVMSFVASIVGIILSAIALGQHKSDITLKGRGFAKAGLIISIISTSVYVTYFLLILLAVGLS